MRSCHVAGSSDPAAGERTKRAPAVLFQWEVVAKRQGLPQLIGHDTAEYDTNTAEQHDKHAFAHNSYGGDDINFDQHEHDKHWQTVVAQEIICGTFIGNNTKVRQQHRCSINKYQRWQEFK